jgi:hypothetical protein
MNPEYPIIRADTVDDLPFDVSANVMATVGHGEDEKAWVFDGFRWMTEGGQPGELIYHSAPQSEDAGFKHCPKCVGTQVITTMPPMVKYECEVCGGGAELLEMTIPLGTPGPPVDGFDSILLEADRLINGDRQQHYGHAYVNFGDIAALWSAYLDKPVSRYDVVNMMIMLKLARTKRQGYHRDSYVDVGGYSGCAEKIYDREQTMSNVFGASDG